MDTIKQKCIGYGRHAGRCKHLAASEYAVYCKYCKQKYELAELEAYWPELPELDGEDIFADYPVAGEEAT